MSFKAIHCHDMIELVDPFVHVLSEAKNNKQQELITTAFCYLHDRIEENKFAMFIKKLSIQLDATTGEQIMTSGERLRLEGRTEGRTEGRAEEKKNVLQKLLRKGFSPIQICELLDITTQEYHYLMEDTQIA